MCIFQPIKHKKVYLEIAEQIIDEISEGGYKIDDKLPSERELAKNINVSRSSVREAFSLLNAAGIIYINPSKGAFVSESINGSSFDFKQDVSPIDLIEARIVYEKSLVDLILERSTEKHLVSIEKTIIEAKKYYKEDKNLDYFMKWGVEFHRRFAELSGNEVLINVGYSLVDLSNHPIWRLLNRRAIFSIEARLKQIKEHEAILIAIRKKDRDLLKKYIEEHLNCLETDMFL